MGSPCRLTTVDALALRVSALAEQISFAPGPMFSNHAEFQNCLRLNFGHPRSPQIDQAIATLGRLAAQRFEPLPAAPRRGAPATR